ncbi:MAG TPA: hybrid sensor histidine kinase/response regulator, partial [Beijerinckiaceae bacterium]|nr:hybrid sensor histidine kinase/response regulator [Beijerinckiaceae bacterium]
DLNALLTSRDLPNQTWPYVYERRRPDGTVLEAAYDRMPGGGYVSTYTDVTERHRAAAALKEANESLERRVRERTEDLSKAKGEAEAANASKTRFLAAASHDLLQPLNAARLFVAALETSLGRRSDGAQDRALAENAAEALRSAEQLLSGLLDISSLDSGAIRPKIEEVPLGPILDRLFREFSALARERGLVLRHVPTSAVVRSDPQLVRRILQNFLSNAVRYTREGRILFGVRRRGGSLRVEVLDTGPGIPEGSLTEIFQEFRRLDPHRAGDRGLGLGLAIVERVAGLLEAPVLVRSELGRGSVFAIELPAAAGVPAPAAASPAPSGDEPSGLTVLCIDNEPAILAGLAALLGQWGHAVRLARDLPEARAEMAGRRPDVILADYHLDAGPNGLEIIEELRRDWLPPPPAALITADRSETVRREAARLGCELLPKPIKPASLRRFLAGIALLRRPDLSSDAA